MKKLSYLAKTIDDEIVKEGLCAVSALESVLQTKNLISVVGGMAVQSYLHKDYRRPTSDIDVLVGKSLNDKDFRDFVKPARDYLEEKGYEIHNGKTSGAYKLIVYNPRTEDKIAVEFTRRNIKNFEKHQKHVERELENSRKKIVEDRYKTYTVIAPEDLVLPKLMRSINTLKRREDLAKKISSYDALMEGHSQNRLKYLQKLREDAMLDLGNVRISEELRFFSDLYDIRVLSETIGYNEDYLNIASNDWETLKEDIPQKHSLLTILPKLNLNFR